MKFLTYSTYRTRKLRSDYANADKERQKQFVEVLKKKSNPESLTSNFPIRRE
jgi:hypothetical protein